MTPYQYPSNNPIRFIDVDGLEGAEPDATAEDREALKKEVEEENNQKQEQSAPKSDDDLKKQQEDFCKKTSEANDIVETAKAKGITPFTEETGRDMAIQDAKDQQAKQNADDPAKQSFEDKLKMNGTQQNDAT